MLEHRGTQAAVENEAHRLTGSDQPPAVKAVNDRPSEHTTAEQRDRPSGRDQPRIGGRVVNASTRSGIATVISCVPAEERACVTHGRRKSWLRRSGRMSGASTKGTG